MTYEHITYKKFNEWCNERAADGIWSLATAASCLDLCSTLNKVWWFKREKVWSEKYEQDALNIVNQIEHKLQLEKERKLQAEREYTEKCYTETANSPFNMLDYRPIKHEGYNEYFMKLPFIIKPEAAYTEKNLPNCTRIDKYSKNIGDYMSQPYTTCSLHESLIYNDHMRKFVYSLDIYPTDIDIYDPLLELTADTVDGFDKDCIDKFILTILQESFLEYDKNEIHAMINTNNQILERIKKNADFLQNLIK